MLYVCWCLFSCGIIPLLSKQFIDDRTLCIIPDTEEAIVITQKDLTRANILGKPQTLVNLKLDALICQDARKLKISIPDDVIERMIEQIQKQNNISFDQFEALLTAEGHTMDSYRQELKNIQLINTMLDFRVYSRANVSYEDITKYYNEHPRMEESRYQLISCFISFDDALAKNSQKEKIIRELKKQNEFIWTQPFWIKESEIADSKIFIKTMDPGSSTVQEEQNGFRIYTLLNKKESAFIPLNERYEEITKILKEPLEKQLLAKYHEELLRNAITIDF
ncbi:MAG TPA: SurA N-terminal domain-containing protein [Patescibacteria group bacterium]|nr:SurA N-terminal domain-containing protein [Patescibacteria group bacterium]